MPGAFPPLPVCYTLFQRFRQHGTPEWESACQRPGHVAIRMLWRSRNVEKCWKIWACPTCLKGRWELGSVAGPQIVGDLESALLRDPEQAHRDFIITLREDFPEYQLPEIVG